jgi:hypothetical protein
MKQVLIREDGSEWRSATAKTREVSEHGLGAAQQPNVQRARQGRPKVECDMHKVLRGP